MNKFSFIELAVLQMLESNQLHGYAMSAKMQELSKGSLILPAGSLYPALHKLERSNLIYSSLEKTGGRTRRIYAITTKGLAVLEQEIKSWGVIVMTMNALLGTA